MNFRKFQAITKTLIDYQILPLNTRIMEMVIKDDFSEINAANMIIQNL
jgi:hypothetical protein